MLTPTTVFSSLFFLFLAESVRCSPAPSDVVDSRTSDVQAVAASTSASVSVILNGITYMNKGLVGFGLIPSNFKESTGDTLGGIGSGIDIKYGTWKASGNGTFAGTFVVVPDRGYNVKGTIDYQARHHEIDFILSPHYESTNLDFTAAQETLTLQYKKTILKVERGEQKTSGLDPTKVREAGPGYPLTGSADPEMPIASKKLPHLTIDTEGVVSNSDGTFWISDEYGPYIYLFSADGKLIQTIQPPDAILPRNKSGKLKFTSDEDPKTGRAGNHGFEGLTLDHANKVLYAMLQSATIQDGGDSESTSRYTRLVAYDVSNLSVRPPLVGEWVVPLPLSDKGNTRECNEIHYVSPGVFLALSRDGDGRGGDDNKSKYKQADLFSITSATDIHNTKYDKPAHPIAEDGKLHKSITPATYVSFVNYIEPTELLRFGLHNGSPNDPTLIGAKWESLTLASVEDPAFPDDFFLFTASDNDFISTQGVALGKPFNAKLDIDNQFLVFRVTLPGASKARG